MRIRRSQLFFVLSQPKLKVHFKILFLLVFIKAAIEILFFMYCFRRNVTTYLGSSSLKFQVLLSENQVFSYQQLQLP